MKTDRELERKKWDDYYGASPLGEEDEAMLDFNADFVKAITDLLPKGGRLLEAGSGAGWQSLALARSGHFQVTLMDFSLNALRYSRQLFAREKQTADFICDDIFVHGIPSFDLVFNAGVLEHYAFEEQVELIQSLASRSNKYVMVLVPNQLCYWYWIWRIQRAGDGDWPYGKEAPQFDLSKIFDAAGQRFLGQTFLGESWTEVFIKNLTGVEDAFREQLLLIHRSSLIEKSQRCYLVAALGSVSQKDREVPPIWKESPGIGDVQIDELRAALADTLALNLGSENTLKQEKAFSIQLNQKLQALETQVGEKEQSINELLSNIAIHEKKFQELEVQLSEREEEFKARLLEKEQEVEARDSRLLESEQEIEARDLQLQESEQEIGKLVSQLEKSEEKIGEQSVDLLLKEEESEKWKTQFEKSEKALSQKVALIQEIEGSRAWKLVKLLWRIRLSLFPHGSMREKTLSLFVRGFRGLKTEGFGVFLRKVITRIKELFQGALGLGKKQDDVIYSHTVEPAFLSYDSFTPPADLPKFDVVFFPIIDWDFRYQRPQHLASQFAKNGHRVYYIQTTFSAAEKTSSRKEQSSPSKLKKIADRIYSIQLPGNDSLNLYRDTIDEKTLSSALAELERIQQGEGINEAVCVVQLPFWKPLALQVRKQSGWKVVYDCLDFHSGFSTNVADMLDEEVELAQQADLITATSQKLYQDLIKHNSNTIRVQNAADYDHFAVDPGRPADIADIRSPIIGYFGAISDWFDVDLVKFLSVERPDWSFVLIGSTWGADISTLSEIPNVHLLGEKPYETLPGYLHAFDVCVIPFKLTPLIQATDPVKFYEYLSAGKPVVSVSLPELKPHAELVHLARDKDDFLLGIEKALNETDASLVESRKSLAQTNTWSDRYKHIEEAFLRLYRRASLIIVTYNNLDLTQQCLASIYRNTKYPSFEIILVDNNSSDGTSEYLSEIERKQDNIHVVLNEANEGFAAAMNQGLDASQGDYVIILNNDIIVTDGWLGRLIRHLDEDPSIGIIGAVTNSTANEACVVTDYTNIEEMESFAEMYTRQHGGHTFPLRVPAMYCVAMRRSFSNEVGPLDERFTVGMFEDDDFAIRARRKGYRVVCAQDVFIHHHGMASFRALDQDEYLQIHQRNRVKFEEKWNLDWQQHQPTQQGQLIQQSDELRKILAQHHDVNGVVIFPPTIGWSITLLQRPHQLAMAFARLGYVVFFCETQEESSGRVGFREEGDRLYIASVPWEVFDLVDRPIVIVHAYNQDYSNYLRNPVIVFDHIDDLEVFPYDYERMLSNLMYMLQVGDVFLVTADRLYEQILPLRADAILCPNGVDLTHFDPTRVSDRKSPEDLQELLDQKKPIIGYYGAFARWFDYELLTYAAQQCPEFNFILIGEDLDGTMRQSGVDNLTNVYYIGERDYSEIPQYLSCFDVATIPFQVNDITRSTSPLKLFEYLAGGKPVVTTALPECAKYAGTSVSDSYDEYVENLRQAIASSSDPNFVSLAREEAMKHDWKSRVEVITEAIQQAPHRSRGRGLDAIRVIKDAAPGPSFEAAVKKHLEPLRDHPQYPVWLNYSLQANQRGEEILKTFMHFTNPQGKRHLDIGCAFGGTCIAFTEAGAESTGLDIDPSLLKLAQANRRDQNGAQITLLERDISRFDDHSELGLFDMITCINVLEHVDDLSSTLSNIYRLLKPNGWLYLILPNARSVSEVKSDGHFGLFGITLLSHDQAKAYYQSHNEGPYGVGEFYDLDTYVRDLKNIGLYAWLIDDLETPIETLDTLYSQIGDLSKLMSQKREEGVISSTIGEELETRLKEYINEAEDRYRDLRKAEGVGASVLRAAYVRDFVLNEWRIMAQKLE